MTTLHGPWDDDPMWVPDAEPTDLSVGHSHEKITFTTPDGKTVTGYEVTVMWDEDPTTAHHVWVIADRRSQEICDILEDETHPQHEEWTDWDTTIFYYCDGEDEFARLCAEGSGDRWAILLPVA